MTEFVYNTTCGTGDGKVSKRRFHLSKHIIGVIETCPTTNKPCVKASRGGCYGSCEIADKIVNNLKPAIKFFDKQDRVVQQPLVIQSSNASNS